jgi:Skp family chaperone for outer membrane proteins
MKKTSSPILALMLLTVLSVYSKVSLAETKIGFVDTVKLMEAAPQAKSA